MKSENKIPMTRKYLWRSSCTTCVTDRSDIIRFRRTESLKVALALKSQCLQYKDVNFSTTDSISNSSERQKQNSPPQLTKAAFHYHTRKG